MTLEDLFRQLSYGELSNLSVAVDSTGAIRKERQNQIVQFANDGLRKLHMRLPLKEDGESLVVPDSECLDTELDDDVLQVVSILGSDGESLAFKQGRDLDDRIWVADGVLHLPSGSGTVWATYRRRHDELLTAQPLDLTQNIELKPELEEALTSYIASKVYAGMNSQDSLALSAIHRQRHEQIVMEASSLLPSEIVQTSKLEIRGFI